MTTIVGVPLPHAGHHSTTAAIGTVRHVSRGGWVYHRHPDRRPFARMFQPLGLPRHRPITADLTVHADAAPARVCAVLPWVDIL